MKRVKKEVTETPMCSTIKDALIKKALGYEVKEVVEEYAIVDKELTLIKKKVNTKTYPPDLDAIELVLSEKEDSVSDDYTTYSDEELLEEKHNLVELFKRMRKEKENAGN